MGYVDFSMSERAAGAYADGLAPLSKLTAKDLADEGWRRGLAFARWLATGKGVWHPAEWHHTSKNYNRTDFYAVADLVSVWCAMGGKARREMLAEFAAERTKPSEPKVWRWVKGSYKTFEKVSGRWQVDEVVFEGLKCGEKILLAPNFTRSKIATGKNLEWRADDSRPPVAEAELQNLIAAAERAAKAAVAERKAKVRADIKAEHKQAAQSLAKIRALSADEVKELRVIDSQVSPKKARKLLPIWFRERGIDKAGVGELITAKRFCSLSWRQLANWISTGRTKNE